MGDGGRDGGADLELFRAWRAGDDDAGHVLFQRYFARVRAFFVNKVAPGDLEDLVQATFLGCVRAKNGFSERSSFSTFILGIAYNILRAHYRERRAKPHAEELDEVPVADLGAGQVTLLDLRAQQRTLLEGLRRVPLASQTILELYYWERMTGPQLAEVLGVPEATVRGRIRRAKALLTAEVNHLQRSPIRLPTTTTDIDAWASSVRGRVLPPD